MVATLAPVAKQWIRPRIFRVTGANQNAQKLLFTDLVNTNTGYCQRRDSTRKVPPPLIPHPLPPRPQQTSPLNTATDRLTCNNLHVMAHTGLLTPCSPSTCLSTSGALSHFMGQLSFPRSGVEKKFFHSTLYCYQPRFQPLENFPHNLNFRSEKAIRPAKKNSSNSYL